MINWTLEEEMFLTFISPKNQGVSQGIVDQRVRITFPLTTLTKGTIESRSCFVFDVINNILLCTIR